MPNLIHWAAIFPIYSRFIEGISLMLRCFISDLLFLSSFRKSVVRLRLASRKTFSWGISVFTMTLNLLFVISTERSNSSFKFSQGCSGISFNHLSIGMASKETNENHYKPLEYLLRIVLIMDELMSLPFNASLLGWGKISSKYLMILSYSGELYMPDSL